MLRKWTSVFIAFRSPTHDSSPLIDRTGFECESVLAELKACQKKTDAESQSAAWFGHTARTDCYFSLALVRAAVARHSYIEPVPEAMIFQRGIFGGLECFAGRLDGSSSGALSWPLVSLFFPLGAAQAAFLAAAALGCKAALAGGVAHEDVFKDRYAGFSVVLNGL